MKHIDPHVHCRDEKEAYKGTIFQVSLRARIQRIEAIFDMPNTEPPIISKRRVEERLKLAEEKGCCVKYYLYVGLTSDKEQIKEAVEIAETNPQVVGLKLYAAKSVGSLGVTTQEQQKELYRTLAELGYRGVLAVHCEKESKFKPELWNPQKPWTHGLARPPEAEIESLRDQIKFAQEAGFKGILYVCHVSCPESVDLIWAAKSRLRMACGVTPHHLLFTEEEMKTEMGLAFKVNPPLRDARSVTMLREYLKQGKIDWFETDHAPHIKEEKLNPPYLSGIATLLFYKTSLTWLNQLGISWQEIEKLTYWNIKRVFGEKLRGV